MTSCPKQAEKGNFMIEKWQILFLCVVRNSSVNEI